MVAVPEALTRDIGPLPVWAWGAAGIGGIIVGRFAARRIGGGASSSGDGAPPEAGAGTGSTSPGLGLGAGSSTPVPIGYGSSIQLPSDAETSNDGWRARALAWAITNGYPGSFAERAIDVFLSGTQSLAVDEQALIDKLYLNVGAPPIGPTTQPLPPATGGTNGTPAPGTRDQLRLQLIADMSAFAGSIGGGAPSDGGKP